MIDTCGTRYEIKEKGDGLWFFNEWEQFLRSVGLQEFDDFIHLSGTVMDRNRRSVVYRLELGVEKTVFYIKIHKNYVKKGLATFFRKVPYNKIELNNMMHYARAGLDELEPVAWGWRSGQEDVSFLILKELDGYISLKEWLESPQCSSARKRKKVAAAVARMLAMMHGNGLAHIDLFTWHIFLKQDGDGITAHPIDLERTKAQGRFPWSQWLIRRKQANDLAVLHLTVPWPQVNFAERMRFYHMYCRERGIDGKDRSFLKLVVAIARHRGRKRKFKVYGVAGQLTQR